MYLEQVHNQLRVSKFFKVFRNMIRFFYLQTIPNEFIEVSEYLFTLGTLITFMKIL